MSGSARTLVLNCGSSSLKYLLLDPALRGLAGGIVERLDTPEARHRHWAATQEDSPVEWTEACPGSGIGEAFARVARALEALPAPVVVAHRVVHGGALFRGPAILDAGVLARLRSLRPLAPLHLPSALLGIEAAERAWPDATGVAVFDTAFHATLPPEAAEYALPADWRRQFGLRRFGFHGSAHASALRAAAAFLGRAPATLDLITLHLGNGASMSAIRQGVCVETSMGFTPLEGLVMGTRSGDIDPALPLWLVRTAGLDPAEVERRLLSESGLRGLCGEADMRRVCERAGAGDPAAERALAVYCHRIRKYLGAYAAVLGHLDAIVFSGGIGENAAEVRRRVCAGLGILGIALDTAKNEDTAALPRAIHPDGVHVAVLVVKADEEREIAREAQALLAGDRGLS